MTFVRCGRADAIRVLSRAALSLGLSFGAGAQPATSVDSTGAMTSTPPAVDANGNVIHPPGSADTAPCAGLTGDRMTECLRAMRSGRGTADDTGARHALRSRPGGTGSGPGEGNAGTGTGTAGTAGTTGSPGGAGTGAPAGAGNGTAGANGNAAGMGGAAAGASGTTGAGASGPGAAGGAPGTAGTAGTAFFFFFRPAAIFLSEIPQNCKFLGAGAGWAGGGTGKPQ